MSLRVMRVLRVILTSLLAAAAIVAGLVVTAVVALTALVALLGRRLLGRRRSERAPTSQPPRHRAVDMGETIDVTATEVPIDPPQR